MMGCAMMLVLSATVGLADEPAERIDWLKEVAGKATGCHHESFRHGAAGNGWGEALTRWTPSGRSYIGSDRSGEALTFRKELPEPHQAVLIRLKLFVIYHWDGNWTVYGPDLFRVQMDGGSELLRTTFSNYGVVGQSYPDDWPWGGNPARAGAAETGTLGWKFPGGWGEPLDAVYDIWLGADRRGGRRANSGRSHGRGARAGGRCPAPPRCRGGGAHDGRPSGENPSGPGVDACGCRLGEPSLAGNAPSAAMSRGAGIHRSRG